MRTAYDMIIKPILTEKSYGSLAGKVYTFQVAKDATKTEIKQAVEAIFGVKVDSVRTANVLGKIKKRGATQGLARVDEESLCEAKEGFQGNRILRQPGAVRRLKNGNQKNQTNNAGTTFHDGVRV